MIGFWRLFIAAAVLAPFAWRRRAGWIGLPGPERALTGLAGFLFFLHLWTFLYAATHTRVANCMLIFSIHPLFTALGARLLFGEPVTGRLAAAYLLAAAGVAGLAHGAADFQASGARGDAAALLSSALFSGYVLCGARVRRRLENTVYAGMVYAVTAGLFFIGGTVVGARWTGYPDSTWWAISGLALGVTLGGHALFTYLLEAFPVNTLSLAKLLEPIGAAAVAYWAFDEPLSDRTVWAAGSIAAAVVLILVPAGYRPDSGGSGISIR